MLVALKLLVVDDDGPTLKLMHKVLTSVKAEVRALRDGEQALTLVNLLQGDDIRVGHPRIELQVVVVGIEDDWHAVVDRRGNSVWSCGQNGASLYPFAARASH